MFFKVMIDYMSEVSLILFEDILHLIEKCLVCCRDFLCNVLLYIMKWVCAHVLN